MPNRSGPPPSNQRPTHRIVPGLTQSGTAFQPDAFQQSILAFQIDPRVIVQGVPRRNLPTYTRANARTRIIGNGIPVFVPPGTQPVDTRVPRQKIPTRGQSRLRIAPTYNSGGISPTVVRGAIWARQRWSALRTRSLPAAQYNSGGIEPTVTLTRPQKSPTRAPLQRRFTPDYNSGGLIPRVVQGIVRRPLRALRGRVVLYTPIYNSGGIEPAIVRGVIWARQRWSALRTRIVIAPTPAPIEPLVVQGIVRRPLRALRGRTTLYTPAYNSGGIQPVVILRGKNWPLPVRSKSHFVVAPLYNSNGVTPKVIRVPRQKPPTRVRAQFIIASLYNSNGVKPTITRGVPRLAAKRVFTKIFFTPDTGIPPVPPTMPFVARGRKWALPTRSRTRSYAPTYNSGGIKPTVSRGRKWAPVTRVAPRSYRPDYNSGGIRPTILRGVPRKAALNGPTHKYTPTYNSGGIKPVIVQGVRRKVGPPTGPRRYAPSYNSGGIKPVVSRGTQWKPRTGRKPQTYTPSYNSGGIKPLVTRGVQWKPRTGGRGPRIFIVPPPGIMPRVTRGLLRKMRAHGNTNTRRFPMKTNGGITPDRLATVTLRDIARTRVGLSDRSL